MPIYEYHCQTCNLTFMALVHMSRDNEPTKCSVCEGPLSPILSRAGGFRGLPTPQHHGATDRDDDDGFKSEWSSIWQEEA